MNRRKQSQRPDTRKKFDRRKSERRSQKRKQQLIAEYQEMLFIILLCFGFGVASVIALFGFFPQATEDASSLETTQVTANKNEAVQTDEDYQAFRETVLAKDEELVENYRNKKRQRRENATHKNNGQKHYEDRIAQIESEMQSELIRKTPMKKGSLSWGLQNDLNKIKSDPPPGFAN